jgi:hypothetical protein
MAITLPTAKTQPKTNLTEFTIVIYGEPKIGKTTFASQFDNPLFLATEAGLNSLEAYQIPITSWDDFLEACALLAKGKHEYKTIVIDTVDNLTKFCSEYVCKKNNVQHESDLAYGKGWTLVKNEFLRVVTKLSLLPYGLILVSHAKTEEIKTRTAAINKTTPTLSNSFRDIVLGMADIVLYAHTIQRTSKDGKVEEVRVLRTKAAETYEAGDRTGKLPEALVFSYEAFQTAWSGNVEGGKVNE